MSGLSRTFVAELVFSLLVLALQKVPRGEGWATLGLVCVIIAALALWIALPRGTVAPSSPATDRVLLGGCAVFAAAQFVFALTMLGKPRLLDIGETTLAAVLALAQGRDPYAAAIDAAAGGIAGEDHFHGYHFHGYKYLPMMIIAYAPLCLTFGLRGIIVTNILLQAMTAAAVRSIAALVGGWRAGAAAAMLYLSLPFVVHQVFTRGVTDLAAILPILLALRYGDDRPMLAGIMTGLSIATKLIPGIAALPCLLPGPGDRKRYLIGLVLGVLPILPFFARSPDAFIANVFLFNMVRPIDDTSWLFGVSSAFVAAVRIVVAAVLAVVAVHVWRAPPRLAQRCALTALAILASFAVGPGLHHNYYLWFLPLLAIVGGAAAVGMVPRMVPSVVGG